MGDGPLVLVVDDDAALQCIIEDTLTDSGFASCLASSKEEAIALLGTKRGNHESSTVEAS